MSTPNLSSLSDPRWCTSQLGQRLLALIAQQDLLWPSVPPELPVRVESWARPGIAGVWSRRTSRRNAGRLLGGVAAQTPSSLGQGGPIRGERRSRNSSVVLKVRFSAAKYSFCRRTSRFSEPVTYVNSPTHLLLLMPNACLTPAVGWIGFFDIRGFEQA